MRNEPMLIPAKMMEERPAPRLSCPYVVAQYHWRERRWKTHSAFAKLETARKHIAALSDNWVHARIYHLTEPNESA